MKEWYFKNGVKVCEADFDYSLHCFKVYHEDKYLGTVYPADLEDMEACLAGLDAGNDPISGGWEDGRGNTCHFDGWGDGKDEFDGNECIDIF